MDAKERFTDPTTEPPAPPAGGTAEISEGTEKPLTAEPVVPVEEELEPQLQ